MEDFKAFLSQTKIGVENCSHVHVVLGNEACDLDSAVSALLHAYYLHKVVHTAETAYIPVLNITRADYSLRTEVTYIMKQHAVPADLLTFRDDLDLEELYGRGKLTLTLVDHNVLPGRDSGLQEAVTEILDHHQKECKDSESVASSIEMVGSCCTLVAENILASDSIALTPPLAQLLYGTILLDTVCLSEAAGRTTPKDQAIISHLESILQPGNMERQHLFDTLQTAKFDVSGLTTMELLRKDMKVVSSNAMNIAFSSVPIDLQELMSRTGLAKDLDEFSIQQEVVVVIVMTLVVGDGNQASRQLAVYSQEKQAKQQIVELLVSASAPSFDLTPLPCFLHNMAAFNQGNVTASRKKLLPLVHTHLHNS